MRLLLGVLLLCVWFAPMLSWVLPLVFAPVLPLNLLLVSSLVLVLLQMYAAPLVWSEANSMRSRRIASEGLAQCIRELAALGYRRVALVAHSHGGNIALKACEDASVARHVSGIVCLSTPFISAWRPQLRITRGFYARAGMLFSSACSCGFLLLLVSALSRSMEDLQSPRMLAVIAGAVLVAVAVGMAALSVSLRVRLEDTDTAPDEDIAGSVCDAAAIEPLKGRTLIITRGGDEADGVLKLASLLNRQIVGMVNSRTGPSGRPGPDRGTFDQRPGGVGDIFGSMVMGAAALLGAVSSLAFGANGLRSPTGVFFNSAEIPPGQWTHLHLSGASAGDGIGLYHSSLYGDPQAIDAIRRWLLELG